MTNYSSCDFNHVTALARWPPQYGDSVGINHWCNATLLRRKRMRQLHRRPLIQQFFHPTRGGGRIVVRDFCATRAVCQGLLEIEFEGIVFVKERSDPETKAGDPQVNR
jgi:hypothetical protein